jgi:uncharacterized caspase-like protein
MTSAAVTAGRSIIAVIGIDRYQHWQPLGNAVSDATGARSLFHKLGFHELVPPLLDERATGTALRGLVADDLRALHADDSLVVFYAGHGGSRTHDQGRSRIKTGYLIPIDAEPGKVATWIDLEGWLRSISLLPPRHILVILDACYSGIALDPVIKWRDVVSARTGALETLQRRRSRRIITSALDDERAVDAGPVPGHSLFTGCLIEALTGGLTGVNGVATGSEIALWVQHRVRTYPDVQQTPDFGTFSLDERGEIVIPLLLESGPVPEADVAQRTTAGAPPARQARTRPRRSRSLAVRTAIAAVHRLRRGGEWLAVAGPLLVIAVAGLLAKSC